MYIRVVSGTVSHASTGWETLILAPLRGAAGGGIQYLFLSTQSGRAGWRQASTGLVLLLVLLQLSPSGLESISHVLKVTILTDVEFNV